MRPQTAYLAGPEVFLPDAFEVARWKKGICKSYGFEAIFPLDRLPDARIREPQRIARQLFRLCLEMMDESSLMIANMSPFRGVSMDVGTAAEMAYMYAMGKPVFGYTDVDADYRERVSAAGVAAQGEVVEDYGLSENLMCVGFANSPFGGGDRRDVDPNWLTTTAVSPRLASSFEEAVARAKRLLNGPSSGGLVA
jgi:nucleoside 2-deoxyribosyltransferase